MVPPSSVKISRVPTYSFLSLVPHSRFRIQEFHLLCYIFPDISTILNIITKCPNPISLAATLGISFDFSSSGY